MVRVDESKTIDINKANICTPSLLQINVISIMVIKMTMYTCRTTNGNMTRDVTEQLRVKYKN